jgi:protein-L-isoaspartate(D-aspartate) O-methyltransferase
MRKVPREAFLADAVREFAYEDSALPIEQGQTISQPFIVARMAEAAAVTPDDRVLEVGAGSGYAAAVLGELARSVVTVERHAALADVARQRLSDLDYANVEVRTGDGTLGWPDAAPFDAILVAAAGPRVPQALKEQLAIGGRLVMPVGDAPTRQTLVRVTRTAADTWRTERLDVVQFVPLIGTEGWPDTAAAPDRPEAAFRPASLSGLIRAAAEPLPAFEDPQFGCALDRYADRRVVLLGEASHGTAEFYRARAAITRRLIERHGFRFVAVEADWPDAMTIDRYVRHRPARAGARPAFRRFPTWMWRNTDVEAFVEWLRAHNEAQPAARRAGFYGLDIYSLSDSIAAVLAYLDRIDPAAAASARERYGCLTPFQHDPAVYGRAVLTDRYRQCERDMVAVLQDLMAKRLEYAAGDGEQFLDAAQNARLAASAERYYRAMYYGGAESWNLRDRHMFRTLEALLEHGGASAKAVVWAHNSHIGDARFTDMGRRRGELNLGELCRVHLGDRAALIGMGTHDGTVAAATEWDGEMEAKTVRPSREDSIERRFHEAGVPRCVLHLDANAELRRTIAAPHLERFIGVIYRPESELASHYAEVELPGQFDAFLWFDRTTAVTPLPTARRQDAPETWPFGL